MAQQRILFVLGGVKDMLECERLAVLAACERLKVPSFSLSLGTVPELTSKCIKTLEMAAHLGWLSRGLVECAAHSWQNSGEVGAEAGGSSSSSMPPPAPRRAPLHIVYELDMSLLAFAQRPEAATLIVDMFRGSHHNYGNTTLSLIDINSNVMSVHNRQFLHVLRAEDGCAALMTIAKAAKRGGLSQVLRDDRERLRRAQGVQRFLLLHTSERAPPLAQPTAAAVERAAGDTSTACVVLLGRRWKADVVRSACGEATCTVASIGNILSSAGFVCMLHNQGLFIPAVEATAAIQASVGRQFAPAVRT